MKLGAILGLSLFFASCVYGQISPSTPVITEHFKKVVYIVFENEDFDPVLHQPDFAKMAALGTSFSQFMAETHPSQGNYIAMVAGSTLGVLTDRPYDLAQNHVGDLLEAKGLDWKVYAEAFPGNCFTGPTSGTYARKHVPFVSFTNVSKNPQRCAKIVNANTFMNDFKNKTLPAFSMYIPDMNNDGHDTGVDYAGQWLSRTFGDILSKPELLDDVLFVLTYDESNPKNRPNQIYTVLIGSNVVRGGVSNQKVSHFALLKMVEDELRLGSLGRLDSSAPALDGIWK